MQTQPLSRSLSFSKESIFLRTVIIGIVALGLLSLGACSALQKEPRLPTIPLLPPAALGQHLQFTQSVTLLIDHDSDLQREQITPDDKQPLTLLAVWSVDQQGLNFAGLTPAGQVLMTLQYDGKDFTESYSPLLYLSKVDALKNIPGQAILAQLQLCYWPLPVIEQHMKNSPWRIIATADGRALYLDGRQVLDIRLPPTGQVAANTASQVPSDQPARLNEVIEIINITMRNKLTITTLSKALLP